jgi:hypothetical protein
MSPQHIQKLTNDKLAVVTLLVGQLFFYKIPELSTPWHEHKQWYEQI